MEYTTTRMLTEMRNPFWSEGDIVRDGDRVRRRFRGGTTAAARILSILTSNRDSPPSPRAASSGSGFEHVIAELCWPVERHSNY